MKEKKKEWDKDQKKKYKNKVKIQKRLIMTLALVINFGILAFLKYYNFFAGSLNDILGAFSLDFSAPSLKLILPLGISFYTFQSMGYIVDVYREKTEAQKNPLKLLLFVSFFPQIIQGPISFYDQLAVQLYAPHSFDFTRFKYGCELILWGFFKKIVIADRAIIAINTVLDGYYDYSGTTLTFTILLYALQLYTDFSGGIDISRGVAQILGIERRHVYTMGDHANDIPMLIAAGDGVAMANAVDAVRAAADVVTGSCDMDGVAMVIESL